MSAGQLQQNVQATNSQARERCESEEPGSAVKEAKLEKQKGNGMFQRVQMVNLG